MNTTDTHQDAGSPPARRGLLRGIITVVRRHLVLSGAVAAVGIGLAIFVLLYFQPQKLFIDDTVSEALPSAAAPAQGQSATNASGPRSLSNGSFRGLAHSGSGHAAILELGGGRRILRLENFRVENGPDLFVYLSATPADAAEDAFPGTFVNLGKLKGNIGSQNYEIPPSVGLSSYNSVVIYCKRFTTAFAVAPLA